ncbi:MAG: O-antigen ligase family protein [Hyphomicrobiaceae bacterium]
MRQHQSGQTDRLVRDAGRLGVLVVLVFMTIVPGLGVLLTGRNLESFASLDVLEPSVAAAWVLRLASFGSVVALAFTIVTRGIGDLGVARRRSSLAMAGAFAFYFGTNVLAPGIMGHISGIPHTIYYVAMLFVALFLLQEEVGDDIAKVARNGLAVFLIASLVSSVILPEYTVRAYREELRLPLVPFRFWGLSSGPNTIAPMALILIFLGIVKPFQRRWLQVATMICAWSVVILAQSQTTWVATAVILTGLIVYRRDMQRTGAFSAKPSPAMLLAGAGLAAAGLVLFIALLASGDPERVVQTGGLTESSQDIVTGRSHIWAVALETFVQHPVFGYGLTAWEAEFRDAIGMSYAAHAHNQLMQALSVGGLTAAIGLVLYVSVMIWQSIRVADATGGLAPALVALIVIRMISEVPLQLGSLLVSDTFMHVLTFAVLVSASPHSAMSLSAQYWGLRDRGAAAVDALRGGGRGNSGRPVRG